MVSLSQEIIPKNEEKKQQMTNRQHLRLSLLIY